MECPNFKELNEVLDDLSTYLFVSLSVRLSERNLTDGRTNEDDDFRDFRKYCFCTRYLQDYTLQDSKTATSRDVDRLQGKLRLYPTYIYMRYLGSIILARCPKRDSDPKLVLILV